MEIYRHTNDFYNFLGRFHIQFNQINCNLNITKWVTVQCLLIIIALYWLQKPGGESWVSLDVRCHARAWQQTLFCILRSRKMLEYGQKTCLNCQWYLTLSAQAFVILQRLRQCYVFDSKSWSSTMIWLKKGRYCFDKNSSKTLVPVAYISKTCLNLFKVSQG
jgi:hypothetical protein